MLNIRLFCSATPLVKIDSTPEKLRNIHFFLTELESCRKNPVGISDMAKIPDSRLTASTQYSDFYQPAYGRINDSRGDGWCAKEASRNDDWLQIYFGKTVQVCAVVTQGDVSGNEWVTDFKLLFSTDGNDWTAYKDRNGADVVSFG